MVKWKEMLSQDNFYWKDTELKLKHKDPNSFDICLYYKWNRFPRPIARIVQDGVYCFSDYSKNNLCLVLDWDKRFAKDDCDVIVRFWDSERIPFFNEKDLEVAKFKAWLLITEKIIKQTEARLKKQEVLFRTRIQ